MFLLIAVFFESGIYTWKEYIYSQYEIDAILETGIEGFWGICAFAILLPIF